MNKLINCLMKKNSSCKPVWFMRQAGRYLPEFREIRSKNSDFIKLCLNSNLSSEITLQPIKRFDLDAAIIFSDILMVPYGLGQEVKFEKKKGPVLSELEVDNFVATSEKEFINKLNPVYKAITKTKLKLNKDKSLISFIGAPWTLIVYMLGIKEEKNILDIRKLNKKRKEIKIVINKLTEVLCAHIKNQVNAGADTIQIFDSWAGLIPEELLNEYCYEPNKKLVVFCKNNKIPVICFPKGLKKRYLDFVNIVKPDGINIDYELNPEWARKNLDKVCIQGGMDPKILLQDKKIILETAEEYLKIFKNFPYIFNLGHGILPSTDPIKIEQLVRYVRNHEQNK